MLQRLALAAVGHVLARERWARDRLAAHAGRAIEVTIAPFAPFAVVVTLLGELRAREPQDEPAAANLHADRGVLGAIARGDRWWTGVRIEGDPALVATLEYLARHLRWDPADDLARIVGDIPAERIVRTGRSIAGWQRDARRRIAADMGEYLGLEKGLAVTRPELADLATRIATTAAAVSALESRIAALDRAPRERGR